jgi:hypothetical protein
MPNEAGNRANHRRLMADAIYIGSGGAVHRPRAGRCLLRHGAGADVIKSEEAAAISIRQTNEPAGTPDNRKFKYRDGDEPHGGGGDDQRRDGLAGDGGRTSTARRDKMTTAFSARRGGR